MTLIRVVVSMLEQWKDYVATHKNTDREHLLMVSLAERFPSYKVLILAVCQLHIAQNVTNTTVTAAQSRARITQYTRGRRCT